MKYYAFLYGILKLGETFGSEFMFFLIILGVPAAIAYVFKQFGDAANSFLLYLSALIPIVGLVVYFLRKNEDKESANYYLGSAITSFVLNLVLYLIL